jgi:hypothetical protein
MTRAVSTLTAATAGLGLAVASTSAKAFVIAPALAAGVLAGGILGGAVLGSAASNSYYSSPYYAAPGVTINSTTCYVRPRLANPVTQTWVNEQVCTTTVP